MTALDFIRHRHTLVLYGICGSGKTMLSIALGVKACMNGFRVKFITLSQLASRLLEAGEIGNSIIIQSKKMSAVPIMSVGFSGIRSFLATARTLSLSLLIKRRS